MKRATRQFWAGLLAVLVIAVALTGCDAVNKGVEAGKIAAATLQHLTAETDRLLSETPADEAAARAAVAGALQEFAKQTTDPNIMQAAVITIRAKVESWDVEGQQAIADQLEELENKLKSGEVEDVQAAVDEVVTRLQSGSTD